MKKYLQLMAEAKRACDDPALALHFGESVDLAEMSIVAQLCQVGTDTREALALLNRFSRLMVDDQDPEAADRIRLVRRGHDLWVHLDPHPSVDFPELTESGLARMAGGFRRIFGDRRFAREVHVTHPAPSYRHEYERIFRAPVIFDCDWNAIRVDEPIVDFELPSPKPYVFDLLRDHAEQLLDQMEHSKTLGDQVQSRLASRLAGGDLGMASVATDLGISRQTLYRRLRGEGLSYAQILDDLRREIALRAIHEQRIPVHRVARRLGYSESSAFCRAFKRWTGKPPSSGFS